MLLLINTSTPDCKVSLIDGDWNVDHEWKSDRNLAKGLLKYIRNLLQKYDKNWSDISAIGVYEGPGSFTGLRIGITVMNTIADAQPVPIVGGRGENWKAVIMEKLNNGKNEKIVLPFYGSDAKTTTPRK